MQLGIGLSVTGGGLSPTGWVARGLDGSPALIDADFQANRYWFNGQNYATETAWLTATGGTKSGITRTIGPYVFGAELLTDGSFTSGADSWALGPATAANGSLAQSAGELVVSFTAGASIRASRLMTVTANLAFVATGTLKSSSGLTSASLALSGVADLNASETTGFAAAPSTKSLVGGSAGSTSLYVGVSATYPATGNFHLDDFSVKQVYPYAGFSLSGLTAVVSGVTPSAASGNKVVAQWGTDSERNRVRIVWDATSHLRVIVTSGNSEQANLDLGVVNASTAFTVRLGVASDNVSATLDGAAPVTDTVATYPAMGRLWIARSVTGETWDGSVNRVSVFASRLDDAYLSTAATSFNVYGDSTANGDGASVAATKWYNLLATSYTPDRAVKGNGVSGQSISDMTTGVLADTKRRGWITVFYDRRNTGETADNYLAQLALATGHLTTGRFLIMPQVPMADGTEDPAYQAVLDDINGRLLVTYPGNTFDATTRDAFLAELAPGSTRSDGLHRNDTGQAIEESYIRTWLDGKGW